MVARSTDGGASWSTAQRVHADDWVFEACPHAGPALAVDSSGTLHVAWWTGREGVAGVYYTRSSDGGSTFMRPVSLGVAERSRPAHVQLAVTENGQTIAVVWDDGTLPVSRIMLRVSRNGGANFSGAMPVSAAGFPLLGLANDSVVVAWSEQSIEEAEHAARSRPDMRDSTAVMPLQAVGNAQVMVRRGVLR